MSKEWRIFVKGPTQEEINLGRHASNSLPKVSEDVTPFILILFDATVGDNSYKRATWEKIMNEIYLFSFISL